MKTIINHQNTLIHMYNQRNQYKNTDRRITKLQLDRIEKIHLYNNENNVFNNESTKIESLKVLQLGSRSYIISGGSYSSFRD